MKAADFSLPWFTPLIIPCFRNSMSNGKPGKRSQRKKHRGERESSEEKQSRACAASDDSITAPVKDPVCLLQLSEARPASERDRGRVTEQRERKGKRGRRMKQEREMRRSESTFSALWHAADDMQTSFIIVSFECDLSCSAPEWTSCLQLRSAGYWGDLAYKLMLAMKTISWNRALMCRQNNNKKKTC